MTTTDRTTTATTGRRALLTGIGAAGIGVVAGCGSSSAAGGSASTSTSPSASASSAAPAPAATASTSAGTSTTASASAAPTTSVAAPATLSAASATTTAAKAGFTVPTSKIPVGSGAYFSDAAVIITQPKAGEFRAFTSICTHQGCPVTMFSGAKMICPCHGSEYSITDGSVLMGPAPAPLAAKTVTVEGADVVVAKT